MTKTFLYSDPHFSHFGVCKFTCSDKVTKLRPYTDPDEMDEDMVKKFNETVGVNDKVYFLGDVVINRRGLKVLERLNCKDLVLIKGNHDIFRLDEYLVYFRDVRAYHVLSGMILSHIPIHPACLGRFGVNIHGHLHDNRIMRTNQYGQQEIDPRYYSVCVEKTEFKPILLDDVKKAIIEQGGEIEFKKNGNG